jgi:hypothetical protein
MLAPFDALDSGEILGFDPMLTGRVYPLENTGWPRVIDGAPRGPFAAAAQCGGPKLNVC